MRIIKKLTDKDQALLLGAYLLTCNIDCRVEQARGDIWELWILEEDKIAEANSKVDEFLSSSDKSRYYGALEQAKSITEKIRQEQEKAAKNYVDVRKRYAVTSGPAPVTLFLIIVCVGLWGLEAINSNYVELFQRWLLISAPGAGFMQSILSGEVWRLFTPMLLHATLNENGLMGVLHILFNMLWLKDLGPIVERRESSLKLILMVFVISGVSNFLQYYLTGSYLFLGFSGVVYGLLGYLWIRGKYDREYGIRLNPGVVWFMLIWLVFGFSGMMGIANYVHLFGLVTGGVWGYANSKLRYLI